MTVKRNVIGRCSGLMSMVAVLISCPANASERPTNGEAIVAVASVQPHSPQLDAFHEFANQILGLSSSTLVRLDFDRTPDQPLTVALPLGNAGGNAGGNGDDGRVYTLSMMPHSVRSASYRLIEHRGEGLYVDVEPGPDRMLRGGLVEWPGSRAAGGLLEDGLYVSIMIPAPQAQGGGEMMRWWIEPLFGRVPGAALEDHVLYRSEDSCCPMGLCGVTDEFLAQYPPEPLPALDGGDGGIDGVSVRCTEMGVDADFEFYTTHSSNTATVQNRVNLVINTMNLQYINQVSIQHVITAIIVRTVSGSPYTSTNASTLLNQFQSHWQGNQQAVPRDVAQLFTGKNLDGNTLGIAYLGGICNSNGYSVVQHYGSLGCATDLSAHELGHNWNAGHCSGGCTSSTMNAGLTCSNTFANSSPSSVDQIVSFRNSRTCLSACEDAALPFYEDFPTTTWDDTKWATISGATISTLGVNEPSPPNSMRLRGSTSGGHQARTARINAAGLSALELTYYYQRGGNSDPPEPGDDLIIEYYNTAGAWIEISRQLGAGAVMTNYLPVTVSFPADARHTEFRVRFRVSSSQNNLDNWFVDNIHIVGATPPAHDTCLNATLVGNSSVAFSTMGATTTGPAEGAAGGGCGFGGDGQVHRDIWYRYFANCTGTATVSVCGSTFDTRIVVYGPCPSGTGQALACNDNFCGASSQVSFPVTQNQLYRVRIGGANGQSGSGVATFSCTPAPPPPPPPCPADIAPPGGDNQVGVPDLLAVISAWGPCAPSPASCTADIAPPGGDNQVGVPDLLAVISAWGACP